MLNNTELKIKSIKDFLETKNINTSNINSIAEAWQIIFKRGGFIIESGKKGMKFSFWYYQKLGELGISPTAEELSQLNENDENLWYCLIIFNQLDIVADLIKEKGVLPSEQDITHFKNKPGFNFWYKIVLFEFERRKYIAKEEEIIFLTLLDNGIVPTYADLSFSFPQKVSGRDSWQMMSSNMLIKLEGLNILPNKFLEVNGTDNIIRKINTRVARLQQFKDTFKAQNVEDQVQVQNHNDFLVVLTREDAYKFLLWTMLATNNFVPLPMDVCFLVGTYLLPSQKILEKLFTEYKVPENKATLIKYCISEEIEAYKKLSFFDNYNITHHEERADSFNQALLASDSESIGKLVFTQLLMFKYPQKTPYANPHFAHQKSFQDSFFKPKDRDFEKVLSNAESLSRNLGQGNK